MNAKEMLDKFSDNLIGIEILIAEKNRIIDEVLSPEIKEKLAEIEAEFAQKIEGLSAENSQLSEQIKEAVSSIGETVSGNTHQAVFSKGRISWDNKALAGYSVLHPEIMLFQKVGNPTVSIRLIGKK